MAFNSYNNNDNQVITTVFSPISFVNSESKVQKTRLNVSYFNKLLKISIGKQTNEGSNDAYAQYDTKTPITVYVSFSKAKLLLDAMKDMQKDPVNIHNVCIELKGGLLRVSDGVEYGADSPCIAITSSNDGETVIYQTKAQYYKAAKNYVDKTGSFDTIYNESLEIEALMTVLEEYWKASTYAVAATVLEAGAYKREAMNSRIYAIAQKVGALEKSSGGGNPGKFLNEPETYSDSAEFTGGAEGYSASSFEDVVNAMN